jgi:tetratricopeptide (TPR) repeat protein
MNYSYKVWTKFLKNLGLVWLMLTGVHVYAQQEAELATEYMKAGEYEKAKTIFQKLAKDKNTAKQIYKPYTQTLLKLKAYEDVEKFVKKQIKWTDGDPLIEADLGRIYETNGKPEEAQKQFQKAIEKAKLNDKSAEALAFAFADNAQNDLAIQTLKAVREQLNAPDKFALQMARIYRNDGKTKEMLEEYLMHGLNPNNRDILFGILQEQLKSDKEILILEKVLYEKVQKYPDELYFNELLIWHLLQQKEFSRAFVQAKAIDKRYRQEGSKVMDIAFLAYQNKDFTNAGKGFEYLVKEYPRSQNYPLWRRMLINSKEEVVKNTYPINESDIRLLIGEYGKLFDDLGINQKTLEGLKSTALLYGFYLNQKDTALVVLEKAVTYGKTDPIFVDRCKLDMGDINLLKSEPWEATLLYSQVEKSQKDSPLGYEAKLRNAKLHYYKGDFELAKEILDILKIATTREIANDALDLGLLIQDNVGQDSTEAAMKAYASTELLLFQNQSKEALNRLEEMFTKYKGNSLEDEILFLKAQTYLKNGETEKGIEDLETIIKQYPLDILGDDAMFLLAKTYQEKQKDNTKAMKLYQQLLVKYPGSIYGAEARKRFRNLRGDTIN